MAVGPTLEARVADVGLVPAVRLMYSLAAYKEICRQVSLSKLREAAWGNQIL
jgi:hypothetical protein